MTGYCSGVAAPQPPLLIIGKEAALTHSVREGMFGILCCTATLSKSMRFLSNRRTIWFSCEPHIHSQTSGLFFSFPGGYWGLLRFQFS